MKIVVFQDIPQENQESRQWVAAHAEKDIVAQGISAKHALRQLVSWLKTTLDESDNRTPSIDAATHFPPTSTEDPDWHPDASSWIPYSSEDMNPPEWVGIVKGLSEQEKDHLVFRDPEPVYKAARVNVVDRFNNGAPFAPDGLDIPEGWDVRLFEEQV